MSKKTPVLICGTIVWAHEEIQQMRENGYEMLVSLHRTRHLYYNDMTTFIKPLESTNREEFQKDCSPGGKYDRVIAIYRHNSSSDAIGVFVSKTLKDFDRQIINERNGF
jgi:glyoxylate reductase